MNYDSRSRQGKDAWTAGYAGHLMGISNTLATLPGIASNLLVGALLQGRGDDWDTVRGRSGSSGVARTWCNVSGGCCDAQRCEE